MPSVWRPLVVAAAAGGVALLLIATVELVLQPGASGVDPGTVLWLGAILAASGGAGALGWQTDAGPRRVALGAAVGAGAFLVLLGVTQPLVGVDSDHGYHPSLQAEVPMNGTWAPDRAAETLELQGYEILRSDGEAVEAHRSGGGLETHVWLRPSTPGHGHVDGTDVVLTTRNGPTHGLTTSTSASTWMEANQDAVDERLAGLIVPLQVNLGWEPTAQPSYEKDLAVG